jgi:hypothetical protein
MEYKILQQQFQINGKTHLIAITRPSFFFTGTSQSHSMVISQSEYINTLSRTKQAGPGHGVQKLGSHNFRHSGGGAKKLFYNEERRRSP